MKEEMPSRSNKTINQTVHIRYIVPFMLVRIGVMIEGFCSGLGLSNDVLGANTYIQPGVRSIPSYSTYSTPMVMVHERYVSHLCCLLACGIFAAF